VPQTSIRSSFRAGGIGPLPYQARVAADGEDLGGGLLVFAKDGYLGGLEYYSYSHVYVSPPEWPTLDRVELVGPFSI
jgi:hypothetical protein